MESSSTKVHKEKKRKNNHNNQEENEDSETNSVNHKSHSAKKTIVVDDEEKIVKKKKPIVFMDELENNGSISEKKENDIHFRGLEGTQSLQSLQPEVTQFIPKKSKRLETQDTMINLLNGYEGLIHNVQIQLHEECKFILSNIYDKIHEIKPSSPDVISSFPKVKITNLEIYTRYLSKVVEINKQLLNISKIIKFNNENNNSEPFIFKIRVFTILSDVNKCEFEDLSFIIKSWFAPFETNE